MSNRLVYRKKCAICGKWFIPKSRTKSQMAKTCSRACAGTLTGNTQRGVKRPEHVKKQIKETMLKRNYGCKSIYDKWATEM